MSTINIFKHVVSRLVQSAASLSSRLLTISASERSIRTMSTPLRLACVALVLAAASGCTNFIVTKGACEEGVNMISYTDDGGNNYGELRLTQP